jgi:FemAB-related protein (PEP-CTERM system-associated)
MVTLSREIDPVEWDHYVERHRDGTADHLSGWRVVIAKALGQQCDYVAARRDANLTGVLPLVRFQSRLFGRALISMPFLNYGGVLADDEEVRGRLLAHADAAAKEFRAAYVELRHRDRQLPHLTCRQHKIALVRPLPATVEALWKETDRKVRNQVRKAQKEGLTVASGGVELVDDFYQVFARNMRDLGTPVYPKTLFLETLRTFHERALVYVVRRGVQPIAAAVAIRCRDTVLVPWASSLREFRNLCPNMLAYWTMIESAVVNGATAFDFGRSSPGGGTHQFKLQWGAVESPLHWEYSLTAGTAPPDTSASNPSFSLAVEAWKRMPMPLANMLGPLIVRGIP